MLSFELVLIHEMMFSFTNLFLNLKFTYNLREILPNLQKFWCFELEFANKTDD